MNLVNKLSGVYNSGAEVGRSHNFVLFTRELFAIVEAAPV